MSRVSNDSPISAPPVHAREFLSSAAETLALVLTVALAALAAWFILVAVEGYVGLTRSSLETSIKSSENRQGAIPKETSAYENLRRIKYDEGETLELKIQIPIDRSHQSGVLIESIRSNNYSAKLGSSKPNLEIPLNVSVVANGLFVNLADSIIQDGRFDGAFIELTAVLNGVSRPQSYLVTSENVDAINNRYHLAGGLTLGALLAIALFSAIVAYLSRDKIYIVFCAWVFTTARIALINGGWDSIWLGVSGESNGLKIWLSLSLALHPTLTCLLFKGLFESRLSKRLLNSLDTVIALSVAVALACIFSQDEVLMKTVWFVSLLAVVSLIFGIVAILKQEKSRTTYLYVAGWIISLVGLVGEIVYAAKLSTGSWHSILNSHTSAIFTVVLTACALAERLNSAKAQKLAARLEANLAHERYEVLYQSTPAGLATIGANGDIIHGNEAFRNLFPAVQVKGLRWKDLQLSELPIFSTREVIFEKEIVQSSGVRTFLRVQLQKQADNFHAVFSNITEQKLAEQKLKALAQRDPLTNLYNRFYLIEKLDNRLAERNRLVANIDILSTDCLALIDIDSFNRIVSNFGHSVGDEVLLEYRNRVQGCLPVTAILGRLSADTLVILMPNTKLNEAKQLLHSVLERIHQSPFETRTLAVEIHASAGVSLVEAATSKEVLATCDAALIDAKAAGGGRLVTYGSRDPAWLKHKAELDLMSAFSSGIPFERMELVFQPIVSLKNSTNGLRYEVLIRMKGEDGQLVSPSTFLPAIEKIGLMSKLDSWVVARMFSLLESEPDHFCNLTYASINLSGASVNDQRFTQQLLRLAGKHPSIVKKVCFEITENIALSNIESTKRFIKRLRKIGARVALDDFGAGYSSFGYLSQLEVDVIKIDGSLVLGIEQDSSKQAIIKTIVDLGRALGSEVVAEWVENHKILATLSRLGVDAGQGWALGRPAPVSLMFQAINGTVLIEDPKIKAILGISTADSLPARLETVSN